MSRFHVLPRKTRGENPEKCPVCRTGWVNLMDINGDGSLLACFACGCVFVSKALRISEARGIKEQVAKQDADKNGGKSTAGTEDISGNVTAPPEPIKCEICGKEVKTKLALAGHMRSHQKAE